MTNPNLSAAPPADAPGVIAPPPFLYAGALLGGLLLQRFLPSLPLLPRAPGVAMALGAGLLLAAGALAVGAFRTMARARTNVNPYAPTTVIVTTGPFRFSRNPIYLSLTLLYLAVALLCHAGWPLVILVPLLAVMQWGVVLREERYLEAKFGGEYRQYRARVRRWL